MARLRDVAFGMLLGAICTGVIASLAAAPVGCHFRDSSLDRFG